MRLLLMVKHYAPEDVSGAVFATELTQYLVHRGHVVTIGVCLPHYLYLKIYSVYWNHLHSSDDRLHMGNCAREESRSQYDLEWIVPLLMRFYHFVRELR